MASLVYLKARNGTTYVYENITSWDSEKKIRIHNRKLIGKVDPSTGDIIPTGKRGLGKGEQQYAEVLCLGNTVLLNSIAESLSLTQTLKNTFPSEWDKILTCAYYLMSEGKALCHVESWSKRNENPFGKLITSQRVSELIRAISPEKQLAFFNKWIELRAIEEYFAVDITSVSSYSEQNHYVRYGYNRDGEDLPVINLCVLMGEKSGLPIYFESLSGSIRDVSALDNVALIVQQLGAKKLHFVLDKGFYSEANVDGLYERHIRFAIVAPFTAKWVKDFVDTVRGTIEDYENFRQIAGGSIFTITDTTK
jgi:hypothetical protein